MTDTTTGPNFTYPPQPPQGWMPPPPPKKKLGVGKIVGFSLVGLLVLGGIGSALGGGDSSPDTAKVSAEDKAEADAKAAEIKAAEAKRIAENEAAQRAKEEAEAEALAAAEAAKQVPPKPTDFTIKIVVLEKSCFGEAGCNVTYRIDPDYTGTQDPNNLEVTYELIGAEDSKINTFTIDSQGTASFDESEFASTATGRDLSAKVTAVRRTN